MRHESGIAPATRPLHGTCGGFPSYHAGHKAVPISVVPEEYLAGEIAHQHGVPDAEGTQARAAESGK